MTTELPDDESLTEFSPRDEIDAVLGYGHPNPERVGCPPPETLELLARRELPIGHSGYEHLAQCSPCYRRVRLLKANSRRSRARMTAAILAALGAAAWLVLRRLLH